MPDRFWRRLPDDAPDPGARRRPAPYQPVRLDRADLPGLFTALPATIWTTDRDLVLTAVQGQLISRFDVDPAQFIGRTLPDLLLDGREDHPFIQAHLAALAGYDSPLRVEWGGMLYGVRVAPLKNDAGVVIGCAGIQQQIGWLPDQEDTLRESDVRLQRLVDASMVGIAFGDYEGRVSDANDAFLQTVGCGREDLTADGLSWPALTPVEQQSTLLAALEEIVATGRCRPFETEIIRRDGARVPVLVSAGRLSAERRDGVAFVLDISAQRRAVRRVEAELAAADALAAATTRELAIADVLSVCRDGLGWTDATAWLAAPEPVLIAARPDGHAGLPHAHRAMASEVVRSGCCQRHGPTATLGVPVVTGDAAVTLVVSGGVELAADAEVTMRIAARLGARLRQLP